MDKLKNKALFYVQSFIKLKRLPLKVADVSFFIFSYQRLLFAAGIGSNSKENIKFFMFLFCYGIKHLLS